MTTALLLIIMLVALAVTGVAHRKNAQAGLIIVLLGAAASFIPGLPRLELEPELILGLVVPPLLYSAAYNTPIGQFGRHLQPILALGVGLVGVTALAVVAAAHWLLPGLSLGTAFLLGAVVAPPDTVTSVSHGRALGLNRRVQSILMGESLVNDAMALTIFALALGSLTHEHTISNNPVLLFLYQAFVGVMVGAVLSGFANYARSKMQQPSLETALGFILPVAAFQVAERLHASGILAVVMLAFSISMNTRYDPHFIHKFTYRTRLREQEFWPVIDALLEAFVFAYMGLQVRFVLAELRESGEPFGETLGIGLAIMLVVMVVRMVWVLLSFHPRLMARLQEWQRLRAEAQEKRWAGHKEAYRAKRQPQPGAPQREIPLMSRVDQTLKPLSNAENLLIGWSGMRGILTLAAAASIPLTLAGAPFPGRAVIQTVALIVTIGTLLIQGFTLPLLSRRLNLDLTADDAEVEEDDARAYAAAKSAPAGDFWAQRHALAMALINREISEEAARTVTQRLDLEQAAAEKLGEGEE